VSAAKWHREQAEYAGRRMAIGSLWHRDAEAKQHHATAADALTALVVGRVGAWLARMAAADAVYGATMTDEERAALATLAKIASEGK
jgi:hypothetical protein